MLYLAIQMAFLLLVSALIGVAIGWWARQVSQKPVVVADNIEIDDDVYTLKNRLDKCFDENASLRRDVKVKETQLNRLRARDEQTGDVLEDVSPNEIYDKVTALMDDLQLRDDTILALEKEIEVMRKKGG